MSFIDPVTPFIEPISTLFQKLTEAEISVHKSIIINHKERQIEYEFQLILSNDASKRELLAKRVQSYFKESFKMDRVSHFYSVLSPDNHNLLEKGVASLREGKFELDVGKLIRDLSFDIASIRLTARIPDDVLQHLIVATKSSSGIGEGNRIKGRMEVFLDYGSAWHKKYDRFEVRDIEYHHTILIALSIIGEVIPKDFYKKMMSAARAYQVGNRDAISFFATLSKNFLLFESVSFYQRVFDTVSVDSEDFEVIEVIPKMVGQDVLPGGPHVLLPGSYLIRFRTRIDGERIANRAYSYVDVGKLKKIFEELIALTNMQTKHLSF